MTSRKRILSCILAVGLLVAALVTTASGKTVFSVAKASYTMSSPTSRTITTKVTVPSSGTIFQIATKQSGGATKCTATRAVSRAATYTLKCRIGNDPMPMPAMVLTLRTLFVHQTDTPFSSHQTVRMSRCTYPLKRLSLPAAHAAC